MNSLTINLDLPRDLLEVLNVPESGLENRLKELIALELFREGRISSGKGAELLGLCHPSLFLRENGYTSEPF